MESFVVMPIVWALGFYYHRFDKRNADYERAMCFLPALIFYFSSWNSVSGTRYQSLLPYFHRSHSLTHTTVCNHVGIFSFAHVPCFAGVDIGSMLFAA